MDKRQFATAILRVARERGLKVEQRSDGLGQFWLSEEMNQSLRTDQLENLFLKIGPDLSTEGLQFALEAVAPGRGNMDRSLRDMIQTVNAGH